MIVFLTSSPTGPLDHSRAVDGLDDKNMFVENLRKYWKKEMKTLYITAMPADAHINEEIRRGMAEAFARRGFYFASASETCKEKAGITDSEACMRKVDDINGDACTWESDDGDKNRGGFDIWDDRTEDFSAEVLHSYDLIILGGGHVPTQNEFFRRIGLREKIQGFKGVIMGISAGTMNSADVVYAQPELEGEAVDPNYQRYLAGLGLTKTQVLPHYQMIKDSELDGMRVFEDITYGDSMGREFVALPDGSYILIEIKEPDSSGTEELKSALSDREVLENSENPALCTETIWGEAYLIKDGAIQQICSENEQVIIEKTEL